MPEQLRAHVLDSGDAMVWAGNDADGSLADALPAAWCTRLPAHPLRRSETLSARRALVGLLGDRPPGRITKDAAGKPRLSAHPGLHVSLSHSHGWGAALLTDRPCGVDLQLRVEKILRLRSKFERRGERAFVAEQADEVAALHVLWGAKEALFKLWGAGEIDWHRHLVVHPFVYREAGGTCSGEVRKPGRRLRARCAYRWVGDQCLVCAVLDR